MMAKVITEISTITNTHQGTVKFTAGQHKLAVKGKAVSRQDGQRLMPSKEGDNE